MQEEIAHLKNSIKILLKQNLELANRVLDLQKEVKDLNYEIGKVRQSKDMPSIVYYSPR